MAIPQDLLEILACPDCKTPVVLKGDRLICCKADCRRAYEVRDDIPIMLIEESKVLDPGEWKELVGNQQVQEPSSTTSESQ